MRQLMPKRMMLSETRKLHYYYRPSPDGRRILFGGRDGTIVGDPTWPTAHLREALIDIFPELDDVDAIESEGTSKRHCARFHQCADAAGRPKKPLSLAQSCQRPCPPHGSGRRRRKVLFEELLRDEVATKSGEHAQGIRISTG